MHSAPRRGRRIIVVLALALPSCGDDDPVTPTVPRLVLSTHTLSFTSLNDSARLTAQLDDGSPLDPGAVSWTSTDSGVATVGQDGWIRAAGNGSAYVFAASGSTRDSASVEVEQVAHTFAVVAGADQTGEVNDFLSDLVRVHALDEGGAGVVGVPVAWDPQAGSVEPLHTSTTAEGIAEGRWHLGPSAGRQQMEIVVGTHALLVEAEALPGAPHEVVTHQTIVDPFVGSTGVVAVRVVDEFDNGLGGHSLTWEVTAGGGMVTPVDVETDESGGASAEWRVGETIDELNEVTVTLDADLTLQAVLSARAVAPLAPFSFERDFVWLNEAGGGEPITVADALGRRVPRSLIAFSLRRLDSGREAAAPAASDFAVDPAGVVQLTGALFFDADPLEVTASVTGDDVLGAAYALAVAGAADWEAAITARWRILAPVGWESEWRSRLPGFYDVIDLGWESLAELFTLPDSAVAYASPSVRGEGRPPFSVAWIEPTRSGCAIAGHPVLFGALCVDWEWTYEVFAHEIGHNVSLEYEGHLAVEVLRTDFKLFEGETGQMMSWWANRYAEASGALDAATQAHVADRLSSFTSTYFDHWVAGGQPYVTLDPSHIASMHAALIATYGWEYWRRYVKAWREDATVRTLLDLDGAGPDESARATFVAAAASAAAEADLLTTFRDDWRFPIDEALYVQLLPHFQGIMGS